MAGIRSIAQFLFSRKVVTSDSSQRHWELLCSVNCNTREDPDLDTPNRKNRFPSNSFTGSSPPNNLDSISRGQVRYDKADTAPTSRPICAPTIVAAIVPGDLCFQTRIPADPYATSNVTSVQSRPTPEP